MSPHLCFFTAMGDLLALRDERFLSQDRESDAVPIFDVLIKQKKPTSKIAQWLIQLKKSVGKNFAKKAQQLALESVTAQGFRTGVVNECLGSMPPEFVAQATGHELKNLSSLYDYMNADPSKLQPRAFFFLASFPLCNHVLFFS